MEKAIRQQISKIYNPGHTLVIGIDGLSGSGKSTISEEICKHLRRENYNTILLHIDDFIHPRNVRYNDSISEWECYYTLQWRYDYLIDVIQSLQKGIDINRKVERYDKENDTYFLEEICAPIGSIIIVEGVFLQREEIRDIFDYIIYIDVPEEVRLGRVLKRDGYIGDKNQIKEKYDNRYFPAEHYYIKLCLPSKNADFIFAPEIKNYL